MQPSTMLPLKFRIPPAAFQRARMSRTVASSPKVIPQPPRPVTLPFRTETPRTSDEVVATPAPLPAVVQGVAVSSHPAQAISKPFRSIETSGTLTRIAVVTVFGTRRSLVNR